MPIVGNGALTLIRQARNGRAINRLALVSLAIIACNISLSDANELFPRAGAIGEALDGLALAYIVAWLINLLVVEVPRQNDRLVALRIGRPLMLNLASAGPNLLESIQHAAHQPRGEIVLFDLERICRDLLIEDDAPILNLGMLRGEPSHITWRQHLVATRRNFDATSARILPLIHLYENDVVAAVSDVINCEFWSFSGLSFAELFGDESLASVAGPLVDLCNKSARLYQIATQL